MSNWLRWLARKLYNIAWHLDGRPVPQLNSLESWATRLIQMTGTPYSRGLARLMAERELTDMIKFFKENPL